MIVTTRPLAPVPVGKRLIAIRASLVMVVVVKEYGADEVTLLFSPVSIVSAVPRMDVPLMAIATSTTPVVGGENTEALTSVIVNEHGAGAYAQSSPTVSSVSMSDAAI
jgi:hypothetical protein